MPEQPIDALSGNDFGRDAPNATAEIIDQPRCDCQRFGNRQCFRPIWQRVQLLTSSQWQRAKLLHAYSRERRTDFPRCLHQYGWLGGRGANSAWANGSRTRSHRRCWPARPDLGERWSSGLVAAASESSSNRDPQNRDGGDPAFLRADVLRAIRAGGSPVGPPVCVRELQILAPLGAC